MKNKAMKIAYYLQRLSETKIERHGEKAFTEACKENGIPTEYIKSLKSIVFPKTVVNLTWPD